MPWAALSAGVPNSNESAAGDVVFWIWGLLLGDSQGSSLLRGAVY